MKNTTFIVRSALVAALLSVVAGMTACSKSSVVSDSPAATQAPAAQPQTATQSQPATQSSEQAPAAEQAGATQPQQPTPSPTLHPIMKQAQSKPGVPVSVPDSMRRPLNAEEMKKAMEAMPPEVRARLQGMAAAPQGAKPQATPKQ
ncbi:MAG: hypothetical protein SF097_06220 [Acidobacteriota bacterium]|nr:hypothetical protein [Acidobacteriota bacterium]